jgi:hypothetical protein
MDSILYRIFSSMPSRTLCLCAAHLKIMKILERPVNNSGVPLESFGKLPLQVCNTHHNKVVVLHFSSLILPKTLLPDRLQISLTTGDHTAAGGSRDREWAARPDLSVVSPGLRFVVANFMGKSGGYRKVDRGGWSQGHPLGLTRGAESSLKMKNKCKGDGQEMDKEGILR